MTPVAHLEVGGQGCFEIRGKLSEDGDDISLFGQLREFLKGGLDRDRIHVARECAFDRGWRKS